MLPIVGFGHSHAWSLLGATRKGSWPRPISFPVVGSKVFKEGIVRDGLPTKIISDAVEKQIGRTGGQVVFGSALYGNEHTRFGIAEKSEPIDLIHPRCSERLEDRPRRIMPVGFMRALILERAQQLRSLFAALKATREIAAILLFLAPPPTESNALIEKRIQESGGTPGHPILRLKIWYCQLDILNDICAEFGAILVPTPEAALFRGFLREEFSKDGVHATPEFGAMMLSAAHQALLERGL